MKISQLLIRSASGALALSIGLLIACQSEQVEPEPDCSVSGLTLTLSEKSDTDCGSSDGSATLTASGGEGTLMFSLSGTEQESGLFEGLSAGNHLFTVTDENGCSETLNVSIASEGGVVISSVDKMDSGCKENNGSITISASEGAEPYQYKLNGGQFQDENEFTDLATGTHTLVVVDDEGCEFTQDVDVLSGISFDADISPIISSSCAVSNCHNGDNNALPDFTTFSVIQSNASSIKSMTASGVMPQDGTLSQTQIDMIACWVDDGALNN